jgi:hypothetical protein
MGHPSLKTIYMQLHQGLAKEYPSEKIVDACKDIRQAIEAQDYQDDDKALYTIDKIIKGYGVESVRDNQWSDLYQDIGLIYVNMGDTYTPTVIYDTRKRKWIVGCLGDVIEKGGKRFEI